MALRRRSGHTDPPTMPRTSSSERVANSALPTPVSCRFARRPTSVNMRIACGRRLLGHVDHLVAIEQRHVGRLAELARPVLELRLGDPAELASGSLPEGDQPGAEGVPSGRQLAGIAEGDTAYRAGGGWSASAGRRRPTGR